ncbi:futalosine hydrolase [Aneurinibacillus sp. REN35]|uniref:futalosine hydrolase n=1 Tax=Aneurinibacillus sp. REN35 TaxID=3237286 RepID=UPI0035287C1E
MDAPFIQQNSGQRVLVVTSVAAEREAVLRGLTNAEGFDVLVAGVGPAAAAASTAIALASDIYALVINVGIAGGFVGRADVGSLVVADEIVAADLGAQTPDGFISVDELGFGSARVPVDLVLAKQLAAVLNEAGLLVTTGAVLSVSTVTGTAATAAELSARIPGAAAEAMEGYGVAIAAQQSGVPVLELRAISNPVGPRDRTAWRMKEALQALQTASSLLPEVVR